MRMPLDSHPLPWWIAGDIRLTGGCLLLVSIESIFDGYGVRRLW